MEEERVRECVNTAQKCAFKLSKRDILRNCMLLGSSYDQCVECCHLAAPTQTIHANTSYELLKAKFRITVRNKDHFSLRLGKLSHPFFSPVVSRLTPTRPVGSHKPVFGEMSDNFILGEM